LRARTKLCTIHFEEEFEMALVPIKTASETGYCDCIHGCYELASLRDEETGKSYCPACAKDHLDWNKGIGIPHPSPSLVKARTSEAPGSPHVPEPADPPGRLR
jgi:hypothetical protein